MAENMKRFRIDFTVDAEGWSDDFIKESAIQELTCMVPFPEDINFSEVKNPWHTGTPTEEGWYLMKVKLDDEIIYDTNYLTPCVYGMDWRYAHEEIIEWQKIEEKENGHAD